MSQRYWIYRYRFLVKTNLLQCSCMQWSFRHTCTLLYLFISYTKSFNQFKLSKQNWVNAVFPIASNEDLDTKENYYCKMWHFLFYLCLLRPQLIFRLWRYLTRGLIWQLSQSSIRPSIYYNSIVKSRSNPSLEPTSIKQKG